MTWYGQNQEDKVLWEKVSLLTGDRWVLDIGAFDGKTNSNSLALIQRGWKAVLVEPSPSSFLKLLSLHQDNGNVTLVNAAMGVESCIRAFYECQDDQYSTFDESVRDLWKGEGRKYRSYLVPQMTPSMLVQQIQCGADVLSIDAEGISFDLLKVLPLSSWCPHVIVVEHDKRVVEICQWGESCGFEPCSVNQENVTLLRK